MPSHLQAGSQKKGTKRMSLVTAGVSCLFVMHLIVRGIKIALRFSRPMPWMNKDVSALVINTAVLCRGKKHCLFLLEYSMHSQGMK